MPGNVGYVGEPGLTCALYVGTTVALAFAPGCRDFAPTWTNTSIRWVPRMLALRWRTRNDLREWSRCGLAAARVRFDGPIDMSLIRSYRGTWDMYANPG